MIAERIDTVVLPGDVVGELTTEHESQQQQKPSLQIGSGCVHVQPRQRTATI
jgi:hypothetical protein